MEKDKNGPEKVVEDLMKMLKNGSKHEGQTERIEMKDVDRVFEVFEQVSGDYDKDNEGAGLGLPLSKRLVELHGGTIELVSRKGTGTVVTVEIPEHPKVDSSGANDIEERLA